jgi:hypothetical protein
MPYTMMAKAAESQALRKQFPEALGGLITLEEMGTDERGGEPGAVPWEEEAGGTRSRARKPSPPRVSPTEALAAARQASVRQATKGEGGQSSGRAAAPEGSAGQVPPETADSIAHVLGEDAPWCVRKDVDTDRLSPPAEAKVLRQHGWEKGSATVDVVSTATGQKATAVFSGPVAAVLATVKRDQVIWVRLDPEKNIAAYHVPGSVARRKAVYWGEA